MKVDSDIRLINVIQTKLLKQFQKEGPLTATELNQTRKLADIILKAEKKSQVS